MSVRLSKLVVMQTDRQTDRGYYLSKRLGVRRRTLTLVTESCAQHEVGLEFRGVIKGRAVFVISV